MTLDVRSAESWDRQGGPGAHSLGVLQRLYRHTGETNSKSRPVITPRPVWAPESVPSSTPKQIPGGWAAAKYGGERVLCTSFILWASASLLMPGDGTRTRTIFAVRVLVGASMGVVFPAIHSTLVQARAKRCRNCPPAPPCAARSLPGPVFTSESMAGAHSVPSPQWIPPHERSRAVSLFTSGMYFGAPRGAPRAEHLTAPRLVCGGHCVASAPPPDSRLVAPRVGVRYARPPDRALLPQPAGGAHRRRGCGAGRRLARQPASPPGDSTPRRLDVAPRRSRPSHATPPPPPPPSGMGWAWLVLWRAVTPKLPGGTGATGPLGCVAPPSPDPALPRRPLRAHAAQARSRRAADP